MTIIGQANVSSFNLFFNSNVSLGKRPILVCSLLIYTNDLFFGRVYVILLFDAEKYVSSAVIFILPGANDTCLLFINVLFLSVIVRFVAITQLHVVHCSS